MLKKLLTIFIMLINKSIELRKQIKIFILNYFKEKIFVKLCTGSQIHSNKTWDCYLLIK